MLQYTTKGHKNLPGAVFLHGYGETSKVWESLTESLQDRFYCVLIDLPGSGASPLKGPTNLSEMATQVKATTDELALSKYCLFGHSMGGYIGLDFCSQFPDTIAGFAMVHSTANADSEEKSEGRRKTMKFLSNSPLKSYAKLFAPNLFAEFNQDNAEWVQNAQDLVMETTSEGLINGMDAMIQRKDRNHVYGDLDVPYLFLVGKYDGMIPHYDMLKQASLCRRSMVEIFDQSGHLAMVEEEQKTKKVVNDYLNWVYNIS